ncbi:MAG: glycosyltransferase family 4 protein [Chloroflexota bacterium]
MADRQIRKVLYVVSNFPSLSATFTAFEMASIQSLGAEVHAASLWSGEVSDQPHEVEQQFLDRLLLPRLSDPVVWLRAFQQLIYRPALFLLIFRLALAHCVSIYAFAKLLATLPKGLYLGWWARQNQVDQIHAHFLTTPALAALLASQSSGIPFTVTIHAFDIFALTPRLRNAAISLKCQRAQFNIAISLFNIEYIRLHWPETHGRFRVIHNGIDFTLFQGMATPFADPEHIRIFSNGRLIPKKGHDDLIRAVGQLRARHYPVQLAIVGQGPEEERLKALVADLNLGEHVHFLGARSQTELVALYQESDIFALACVRSPDGDMDGLPTVLIEALALALPTVSTHVSGIPEIIRDGDTGRCVPPRDPTAFAEALVWMINHPQQAREMGLRGQSFVRAEFDSRRNAAKLFSLWEKGPQSSHSARSSHGLLNRG